MNIAVFAKGTHFHKTYGGLETQNRALCDGLASRGHTITVFTPQKDLNITSQSENGVNYVFVPCKFKMGLILGFFGTLDPKNWFNMSYQTFKTAHQAQPFDLVISQSSAGVGIIRRKQELNVKVVAISHGTILSEYKTYFGGIASFKDLIKFASNTAFAAKNFFTRQRETIRGADKVVAVSNYVKRALIDETFVPENKIEVIFNGIDESKFASFKKQSSPKKDKLNLIFVGRIVKSKGVFELLALAQELKDVMFTVIGDGDDMAKFKNAIKAQNLENSFNILGWQSSEGVMSSFFNSDVFLFPTKRVEGFPMTIVEAMFAGLPVVAYNLGGVADSIETNETGFLVAPNELTDFKNHLLELVTNETLRKSMSEKALRKAFNEFTLNVMLDKYEKLIMKVLNK